MLPEIKAPSSFSLYDITGYLMPGLFFVIIMVFEFDMGRALNFYFTHNRSFEGLSKEAALYKLPYLMNFLAWAQTPTEFKIMPLLLLLLMCYLLGHVIAAISSLVIEKFILGNTLVYPDGNLFRPLVLRQERHRQARLRIQSRQSGWRGWWAWFKLHRRKVALVHQSLYRVLAPRYCRPLDTPFINEFKKVINHRFSYAVRSGDYFWLCYADVAHYRPTAHQRVHNFVNLYGFARNTSMTFLLYICLRMASRFVYASFDVSFVLNPVNKVILTRVGDALRQLGRLDEAKEKYQAALKVEFDVYAVLGLATVYKEQGRYQEAIDTLSDILANDPNNPRIYSVIAECQQQSGDRDAARATLKLFYRRGLKNQQISAMLNQLDDD